MVDFEEWLAYKIQLQSTEWIVSLSANWDQRPKKPQNSTTCQNLLKTDKVKKNVDINNWNIFPGYKKKIRKVKD